MKKITLFLIVIFLFSSISLNWADEGKKDKSLEAIEFLTGFGWGKLGGKNNYNLYPIIVDFDFNLKPLTKKININPNSLLQFQIEPYFAGVSSPDSNIETGASFFLKFGVLPQTSKLQPYAKLGTGLSYMTQHTREQSTQFNFISSVGLGAHYFVTKNTALTIEGRYRHLSNASIKSPNRGIETAFACVGINIQF